MKLDFSVSAGIVNEKQPSWIFDLINSVEETIVWLVARGNLMFTTKTGLKFEHQISEANYYTQGLWQKDSFVFIVQR